MVGTMAGAGRMIRPGVLVMAAAGLLAMSGALALAQSPPAVQYDDPVPFTQEELDDNWTPDRRAPSDGWESVSFAGRDDVARIGIDSDQAAAGTFNRTEGIKKIDDFQDAIQIDLYLDPAWQGTAVRAGVWVAGWIEGGRTGDFAILEFTTAEEIFAPPLGGPVGQDERWRVWTSATGWTDLRDVPVNYEQWVTLNIVLDAANELVHFYIDGELVSSQMASSASEFIGEVILNSYNYGNEDMDNGFNNDNYEVHWHSLASGRILSDPETRTDCMNGGWEGFGFRNQGQCIQFVNTGKDSR